MLNLTVYEDVQEQKSLVRLKLHKTSEGVDLDIVDEDGDEVTTLLRITNEGKLYRFAYVDEGYGFELNDREQIELTDSSY